MRPTPHIQGVGVVVEGVCLLVFLIGRLGRHGAGLVDMINEVPEVVKHKFGPPAVQCEYKGFPIENLLAFEVNQAPSEPNTKRSMRMGLFCLFPVSLHSRYANARLILKKMQF